MPRRHSRPLPRHSRESGNPEGGEQPSRPEPSASATLRAGTPALLLPCHFPLHAAPPFPTSPPSFPRKRESRGYGQPRHPKPSPNPNRRIPSPRAIASYCASRSIVRRYPKSQPALFRFAAIPIFSDFYPFTKFSVNFRSVDMFSAACPTPDHAPVLPERRAQRPVKTVLHSPMLPDFAQNPIRPSRHTRYEAPPVNRSLAVRPPRGLYHLHAVHVRPLAPVVRVSDHGRG